MLKLSYGNTTCNHDVNDDISSWISYRGDGSYDCHDGFNHPLHVPINAKLHSLNICL
jgi:hypothetical protein